MAVPSAPLSPAIFFYPFRHGSSSLEGQGSTTKDIRLNAKVLRRLPGEYMDIALTAACRPPE